MPTKSSPAKAKTIKAVKKPRTAKKKPAPVLVSEPKIVHAPPTVKPPSAKGKYIFATGRRKTSVANIRLFEGPGKHLVNKKPFEIYFSFPFYREKALKPFSATGLGKNYHVFSQISGGGVHSQAEAFSHGLATALGKVSPEIRKVLKKSGLLTRDDRKKERKKPGLKRARRAPQWAKR